jgi:toxoflavin biosynthesis protein ToxC
VVTGAYDGAVGVFELERVAFRVLGYHDHLVNRVVLDRSGMHAASCSSDYTIRIWDVMSGCMETVLRGHADDVEDFVFVDDGTGVSASRDRRILVWDLATGAIRSVLDSHEKDVLSLAVQGGMLYSSGDDKTLRVWDLANQRLVRTFGPFVLETDSCAIDPTNNRSILGCDDGVIRIFDMSDGALHAEIPAHSSGIKKVVASSKGHVLSAAYDQRIIIWSGSNFKKLLELDNVKHKWERSFSFSADGERVFAGTFDGTLLEWDVSTGHFLREIGADGHGNACFNRVSASADGAVVAVADDGIVRTAEVTHDAAIQPRAGQLRRPAVPHVRPDRRHCFSSLQGHGIPMPTSSVAVQTCRLFRTAAIHLRPPLPKTMSACSMLLALPTV